MAVGNYSSSASGTSLQNRSQISIKQIQNESLFEAAGVVGECQTCFPQYHGNPGDMVCLTAACVAAVQCA